MSDLTVQLIGSVLVYTLFIGISVESFSLPCVFHVVLIYHILVLLSFVCSFVLNIIGMQCMCVFHHVSIYLCLHRDKTCRLCRLAYISRFH